VTTMTPNQVLAVSFLGGLAALISLVLAVALAIGIHTIIERVIDHAAAWRERRAHQREQRHRQDPEQPADDLTVCQAINALPTHRPTGD